MIRSPSHEEGPLEGSRVQAGRRRGGAAGNAELGVQLGVAGLKHADQRAGDVVDIVQQGRAEFGITITGATPWDLEVEQSRLMEAQKLDLEEIDAADATLRQVMQLPAVQHNTFRRCWLTSVPPVQAARSVRKPIVARAGAITWNVSQVSGTLGRNSEGRLSGSWPLSWTAGTSTRMPGPEAGRNPRIKPGEGMKPAAGSSA